MDDPSFCVEYDTRSQSCIGKCIYEIVLIELCRGVRYTVKVVYRTRSDSVSICGVSRGEERGRRGWRWKKRKKGVGEGGGRRRI